MTDQILADAINLAFVFINRKLLFGNHFICHKSSFRSPGQDRTKMKLNGTYLKLCLNASGEWPVCFLKKRIK